MEGQLPVTNAGDTYYYEGMVSVTSNITNEQHHNDAHIVRYYYHYFLIPQIAPLLPPIPIRHRHCWFKDMPNRFYTVP
jgi:hypothetical protein